MILAGQLAGEEEVQRFHAEAEAAAHLDHPGIVPIYEVGEVEGQHYFSMGYVDGCSLADMIAEHPLPAKEAAFLMIKIADAVHYAHEKGVIHRDLKPANVLVQKRVMRTGSTVAGPSSETVSSLSDSVSGFSDLSPRVTDFGLAKQIQDDDQLTATGQILGTPSYMPPEQASGKVDQIDHRADVYSLGGILYALVTGRPPFQASNPLDTLMQVLEKEPVAPRQLNPNIPRDIETIALKALEKDAAKRYQSALEFSEELGRFLRGDPIKARPISAAQRAIRRSRRHRALAGLIASVFFLSISGPLIAVRQNRLRVEASQNARRAQQLAERESAARKEAEQSRADLAAEMERGDQALYARSISLAHREWLDGNPARTRQLLAQCSPDKRGWEWQYLDGLTRAEDSAIFAHQVPAGISLSPSGNFLLTRGLQDSQLKLWDVDSGLELDSTRNGGLKHANFISDTHLLVVAGDSVVHAGVLDEEGQSKPEIVRKFGAFGSSAMACRLIEDSGEVATAFQDGSVIFYDLKTGDETRRMPKKRSSELPHVFSHDGELVAGLVDKRVRVWDTATGEERFEVAGHVAQADVICFRPDASIDGTIGISDWKNKQPLGLLKGHSAYAVDVCFNPDGSRLLSSSEDKTAKIWDVNSFNELITFKDHRSPALGADWSGDGKTLASTSRDGTLIVWELRRKVDPAEESEWITVFEDDFERSTLGRQWNPTTADAWKIENGRLVGTLKSTEMPGTTFPAAFIGLAGVDIPKQVEVQADVRLRQPMLVQVVLSNQRTSQYIAPFIAPTAKPYGFAGSAIQVAKGAGEETKLLNAQVGTQLTAGKDYRLKVRRQNDDIQLFLDGKLLSETRIPMLETDTLTFSGCWSNLGDQLEFDNVVVRIPESLQGEAEIRGKVNGWLSQYLVPQLVENCWKRSAPVVMRSTDNAMQRKS